MSELLGRIFPAIRDVRTPLIVGCAWLALLGFALALSSRDVFTEPSGASNDPVIRLLDDLASGLPEWVVVAAIALMATIVGLGIARLADRMRQAFRFPKRLVKEDGFLKELDIYPTPTPAPTDQRLRKVGWLIHRSDDGTRDSPLDRDRAYLVAEYVRSKSHDDPARREWGGPEESVAVFRDDLRLFLFHLARDERFDGYNDQQLLRFSLIPPFVMATGISFVWMLRGYTASKLVLLLFLLGFVAILSGDRFRLRSLLIDRWEALADEYPTWLPDAALDRRNLGRERVREILHGEAGIRSVAAYEEELSTNFGGPDDSQQRLRALRATSTQIRLSGAPLLADELDSIIEDKRMADEHFSEFYRLAARWSGSRIEYCNE